MNGVLIMKPHYVVWSDACFSKKKKECNISYIVKDENNKCVTKFYGRLNFDEVVDINIAEYMAIHKALEYVIENNIENFTLYTDSETVHTSLHREKKHKLMYLREHLMEMLQKHHKLNFLKRIEWASRLYNKADYLCREQNVERAIIPLPIFPLQRDKSYRLHTKVSQKALESQLTKFEARAKERHSTDYFDLPYNELKILNVAFNELKAYSKYQNYSEAELRKILTRNLILSETYIFDNTTKLYVFDDMHIFIENDIIKVIQLKETKLSKSFDRNPILEWIQPLSYKLGIA